MKKVILFIPLLFVIQMLFAQRENIAGVNIGAGFGTKILMADNTEKNIEDIKQGDIVKIYDTDSLKFSTGKVKKLVLTGGSLIRLTFTGNKWIHCSGNQPFFSIKSTGENVQIGGNVIIDSTKKIWVAQDNSGFENVIDKLQIKDNVYLASYASAIQSISLKKIEFLPTRSARRVYTLELENGSTFIANGFVVKAK